MAAVLTFRDGLYAQINNMDSWPLAAYHDLNNILTGIRPSAAVHLAWMEKYAVLKLQSLNDPGAAQAAQGDFSAINPADWQAIIQMLLTDLPQIIAAITSILALFGGV